jgi:uncharacterized protein (TIGR02246 family)
MAPSCKGIDSDTVHRGQKPDIRELLDVTSDVGGFRIGETGVAAGRRVWRKPNTGGGRPQSTGDTAMRAPYRLGAAIVCCGLALATGVAVAAEPVSAGECFVAGMKANDADAVAACYADDAIIWFPGGSMAKGRAAIRDGFAHYMATMTVKDATLSEIGGESMGDTRVAWGTYAITLVDKASKAEMVENGRYVDVQKKIDGRWQYIVDHPSDDPKPAAK